MKNLLENLGALRTALIVFAITLLIIRPAPGADSARSGIEVVSTLVAPAMFPIVFLVLLFDVMMSRMRMSDPQVRSKFRTISNVELITATILLLFWWPYISHLLGLNT